MENIYLGLTYADGAPAEFRRGKGRRLRLFIHLLSPSRIVPQGGGTDFANTKREILPNNSVRHSGLGLHRCARSSYGGSRRPRPVRSVYRRCLPYPACWEQGGVQCQTCVRPQSIRGLGHVYGYRRNARHSHPRSYCTNKPGPKRPFRSSDGLWDCNSIMCSHDPAAGFLSHILMASLRQKMEFRRDPRLYQESVTS